MRQVAAGAALTVALAGIVGGVYVAQQPRERVELIQPASGVQTPVPVETSEPSPEPTDVPTTSSVQAETTALPRVNLDAPVAEPAPVREGVSPKPAPKQQARQVQSEPSPASTEPPAPAVEEPAPSEPAAPSEAPPTTTNAGTSSPLPVPGLSRPPVIPEP
jgi:hypothetical protein